MDKMKIKISEFAYEELKKALDQCPEFSFIRLAYSGSCPNSSKIEIILDNIKDGDIKDKVDELPFIYDYHISNTISELTIVYKDLSLQIKTEFYEPISKSSGCSGCSECSSCK